LGGIETALERKELIMKKLGMAAFFFTLLLGATTLVARAQGLVIYADTVLYNGKIVTVDGDFHIHQAIAIKDDKIMGVGTSELIRSYAGPTSKVIDLQGKTVLPGFVDTHSHPHEAGLNHYAAQSVPELRSKLVKGRNFEDFLSGIKEIADKTPANV
jgi:predicted amidohydrolase YtcJ